MKQLLTLFIAITLSTIALGQKATLQTTAQEWNLKGNVKSIHESLYDYVDNNGQMEKGNLITGASPL
ncbi:MAG: hypothetical protein WBP41_14755, partial [Saprospiraceae bacterium]